MSRKQPKHRTSPALARSENGAPVPPARLAFASRLEVVALFVLLLVVAMRPLLSETYDSSLHSIAKVVGTAGASTPATTAWFDFAIWLAALLAVLSKRLQRKRWRLTGIEVGAALMIVAAIVSTLYASNKRLAINASCDWLTAIVLLMALANLCRTRLRIALLLAVLAASGITTAARCGMQVGVEFAETQQVYEESKDQFWAQQGVELDDPRVILFEKRMAAQEASGFFPHSNTTGSWLGLSGFAVLAVGMFLGNKRGLRFALYVVGIVLLAMILVTGSKAALAAGVLALVLLALLIVIQQSLRRQWLIGFIGAWIGVLIALGLGLSAGLKHGTLPGDSLAFRWNYWQVSSEITKDQPWTGTGALNFDRAYLMHKPIDYPEEIKDPHNFVVSVFTQWGIPGGVGLIFGLLGASYVAARTWAKHLSENKPDPPAAKNNDNYAKRWIVAGVVGFVLLRLWLLRDLMIRDVAGQAYVFFDIGSYGLIWCVCFAAIVWLLRNTDEEAGDGYRLACLCGVVAFMLHNLVGISFFFPGTLTPFMAMGALLLADLREDEEKKPSIGQRMLPIVVLTVGLMVVMVILLLPVGQTSHLLNQARGSSNSSAIKGYTAAAEADPFDPTPYEELANRFVYLDVPDRLARAVEAMHHAISRDPLQVGLYRTLTKLYVMRFGSTRDNADLAMAVDVARQVVRLYPASPDDQAVLADVFYIGAMRQKNPDAAGLAIEYYRYALKLDEARPEYELRRWPVRRKMEIDGRIHELQLMVTSQPISAPAGAPLP